MIALVAGVVVGVTMMGYSTAAPAAAPAATADVAAMSVEDAKAAAMRDFGEVRWRRAFFRGGRGGLMRVG